MPDQPDSPSTPTAALQDRYFILKECRELFQRRLVDIAGQSGISSPTVLAAFSTEIGKAHDELVASTQQDGFEQTAGLTASRISLVGNDDLELEIRIGEIATHLKGNDRIEHWRGQLRYMSLLDRPKMTPESNPIGLEPICRGLWAICDQSGGHLDRQMERLERLEEQLQTHLPEVYVDLNNLLERHLVPLAQVQAVQRSRRAFSAATGNDIAGNADRSGAIGHGGAAGALPALQHAVQQQYVVDTGSPGGALAGSPAGESQAGAENATGNFALNASTAVMLNHLMERLYALERQADAVSGKGQPPAPLRAKDMELPLGHPATIAMDTLSLIFESIASVPELPDAVKAAIGRLQTPLIKVAVTDASFFADTEHPARRLINRMARAAVGLAQDAGRTLAICRRIGELAEAARTTLVSGDGNLTPHVAAADTLIAERDRAVQDGAQAYARLVLEHEARELAVLSADNWLATTVGKTREPFIEKFLADYWHRAMQAAYLEGGTAGARWQECAATIADLLWSLQPPQTAEDRKRLLALIPSLIKRVNAELDALGISRDERAPFLNLCFDLQTAALRGRPEPGQPQPAPAAPVARPVPAGASKTLPVHVLERNGKLVQYVRQPDGARAPWRSGGPTGKEGDWLSFLLPDGENLCGRHCGGIPRSGTILLFNGDWGFAVALPPTLLEQQLRDGHARVVSGRSFFDEAAERALRNMPGSPSGRTV
jgi:hypothetical protein